MRKGVNLTGQKFGKLIVLEKVQEGKNKGKWECQCECGNIVSVRGRNLKKWINKILRLSL